MNYYYLVSSLPSLALETEPPISFDEFLLLCSEHLTAGDMANLKTLDSGKTGRSRFARTWRECESVLRNALVKVRAARLKTDPEKYTRETATLDMRAEKTAAEALAKENPLDREMLLDRFRWQQAEELAGFNPFSSDAVMAYALKLKLAERWARLDEEKAKETVSGIINREPDNKELDQNNA